MDDSDPCDWHEAAIFGGKDGSEALLQLARSPIGDECQRCPVCRSAQEYVERRLAEKAGRVLPPTQNGDAAWKELRAAVDSVRASPRKST
jgi:hypothetical protein